jgi:hypothetical protein
VSLARNINYSELLVCLSILNWFTFDACTTWRQGIPGGGYSVRKEVFPLIAILLAAVFGYYASLSFFLFY